MKKWRRFLCMLLVCFTCFSAIQVNAEKILPEEQTSAVSVDERMKKAEELGLEKWVNADGYLLDAFYENKSDKQLEDMGVHALIDSITPEELDALVSRLNAGIALYSVTSYRKIQEGYDITGVFEVDGVLAYCIQHDKVTPPQGSPTSTPVESTKENLRKVLYYGYNGPEAKGYSYVQTAMAASNANGVPAGNTGKRVLGEIAALPAPPKGFHVWVVHTNESKSQDLAYYTFEKKGTAQVKKSSANTAITDENSFYSLEGAVYGLYSDEACTKQEASLTTNEKGESNVVELLQGDYFVKEVTAPKGYALNKEVKEVSVVSGQTTLVTMSDAPQWNPIENLLEKSDVETGEKKPQNPAEFQGAQFEVKFYKGAYKEGAVPVRKWIFRTDADGIVKLTEEYKVSGDALWVDAKGNPVLPLGTVTVQETKPPQGYHLNPELFVKEIKSDGTTEFVHTFQKVIVGEEILRLDLVKRQAGTDIVIPRAEFEHTRPDGTKEILITDDKGTLTCKGLQHGVHQIKEVSVMDGYLVNKNVLEFTVSEKNEITLQSTADETDGEVVFQVNEEGNIVVEMEDLPAPFCLIVHKQNEEELKLEGAEFTLYSDKACTSEVTKGATDAEGLLKLELLEVGKTYYLQETKAPKGYRIPVDLSGNPIVYKIRVESTPVKDEFVFYVNEKAYDSASDEMFFVTGTKAEREVNVVVVNERGFKLPETGSGRMIPILMTGAVLCSLALMSQKRRKTYER